MTFRSDLSGVSVASQGCPLVPIMPDSFDFRREMTSFWATETVWTQTGTGTQFFSKIEQRPSFVGKGVSWGFWGF